MIIKRDRYLNDLIGWKHTDLIKIVTGIRRWSKPFLLLTLFHQHLLESSTDEDHIIEIDWMTSGMYPYRAPCGNLSYEDVWEQMETFSKGANLNLIPLAYVDETGEYIYVDDGDKGVIALNKSEIKAL